MLQKSQKLTIYFSLFLFVIEGGFYVKKHVKIKRNPVIEKNVREFFKEPDSIAQKKKTIQKININEVSWQAFTLLPGIGEYTAKKIIAYRHKNGRFRSVYELRNVKGIGKAKLDSILPYIEAK